MKLSISKNRVVFANPGITFEEVKKAQTFVPEACVLKDEKGNQLFRIAVGEKPSFDKYSLVVAPEASWAKLYESNVTTEEVTAEFGNALVLANKTIAQIKEQLQANLQALEGLVTTEE